MAEWNKIGYTKLSKSGKSILICIYGEDKEHNTYGVADKKTMKQILKNNNTDKFIDIVVMKEK